MSVSQSVNISFIMPIYNMEKYISQAINSILKAISNSPDIKVEIILVNDGTLDSSLNIALDYQRKYPFIYVISQTNGGLPVARNTGLRFAKGDYVLLLDPDDCLDKNINLSALYHFAKSQNAMVVKGQFYSFLEDSNKVEHLYPTFIPEVQGTNAAKMPLKEGILKLYGRTDGFLQMANLFLNREFLIQNKLSFHPDIPYGDDSLFLYELFALDGELFEVPMVFLNYRVHPESMTGNKFSDKNISSQLTLLDTLISRVEIQTDYFVQLQYKYACCIIGRYIYSLMKQLPADKFENFYARLPITQLTLFFPELEEKLGAKFTPNFYSY